MKQIPGINRHVLLPYQHLCMQMQKNINFHVVTHTRLTPQMKCAIRQRD